MDPSSAHRKIELQSPEDLTYLVGNVRKAAAARLDEAFPAVEGVEGEDELRTQIERLVNEYINTTFTHAAPNLSINGLDVAPSLLAQITDSPQQQQQPASVPPLQEHNPAAAAAAAAPAPASEQYLPFDGRKRARLEALAREEEDLLREISGLKRTVPGAVAARWARAWDEGVAADGAALRARVQEASESSSGGVEAEEERVGSGGGGWAEELRKVRALERQEAVERAFADAVKGLEALKRDMPAAVARMDRARTAGEYVLSSR